MVADPVPHTETDLRPHFDVQVPQDLETTLAQLADAFEEGPFDGKVLGGHAQLMIPAERRHMWSPWLTFEIRAEDDGTRLEGRFAPHPTIWTLYLALYAMLGFSALGLTFFGLSQSIAEQSPTALWGVPVCLGLAAALFGLGFVGKGLTGQQMAAMRRFVQGAVGAPDAL